MKKQNFLRAIAALAILAVSVTVSAASFTDEQLKAQPCLDQAPLPWRIDASGDAVVPAYKQWAGVWSGYWFGPKKMCHLLVLQRVSDNGEAELVYSTGKPYYEYGTFQGKITKTSQGEDQLEVVLGNGTRATYILIDKSDGPSLVATYGGFTGGELKPVPK